MEILKRLFGKKKPYEAPIVEQVVAPTKFGEPSRVDMTIRVLMYTENGNEQVRMAISGLGNINVCLASFLTKGVSYAQEKFNEYKTKGEEVEPVDEPKEPKPNTRKMQRGGKR